PAPNVEHFNILDPFHKTLMPLDSWVTEGIDWVVTHFRPVFQGVRVPVDYILNGFQQLLLGMPAPVAIIVFALIAWQISGVGMGVATDRKSTRLNSSHVSISYAVCCLKYNNYSMIEHFVV